jgi:aspartate carbamoyltransferase catalytic subunit
VADGTRSLILDQVTNGLAVRMAVLYLLTGGAHAAADSGDAAVLRKTEESRTT